MTADRDLALLPRAVQAQLVDIVRAASAMDREQVIRSLDLYQAVMASFLRKGTTNDMPAVVLLGQVAELLAALDRDAHPRTPEDNTRSI